MSTDRFIGDDDEAQAILKLNPPPDVRYDRDGTPYVVTGTYFGTGERFDPTTNEFCATGKGGGVKPNCKPGAGGGGGKQASVKGMLRAFDPPKAKMYNKLLHEVGAANRAIKAGKDAHGFLAKRAAEIKQELANIRASAKAKFAGKEVPESKRRPQGPKEKKPAAEPIAPAPVAKPSSKPSQTPKVDPALKSTPEAELATTEVKSTKQLGGGCNGSYVITLATGAKGVWKPADDEHGGLRVGVAAGTYYKREAAAYSVAKAVGLDDLVPMTVTRKVDGKDGSVQAFQEGATTAVAMGMQHPDVYDGEKDLARAAAFDYLIGHSDRHGGNWMLKDGKLRLIDNGLAFPTEEGGFGNWHYITRARQKSLPLPPEIAHWDAAKVKDAMEKQGLEKDAVDLTLRRLAYLKERQAKGKTVPPLNRKVPA